MKAKRKILVVEDEDIIRALFIKALTKEHYEVVTANHGIEALSIFQRVSPDLVITDVRLPDIDGFQLATLIRHIDSNVPIIFMTAFKDSNMGKYHKIEGTKTFLQKPIRKEDLIEVVYQFLAKPKPPQEK